MKKDICHPFESFYEIWMLLIAVYLQRRLVSCRMLELDEDEVNEGKQILSDMA